MRESRNYSVLKGVSATYLMLLGALVVFVVLMGITFIAMEQQDERSKLYITRAGELRLLSHAIVTQALEAARGRETAFDRL